MAPAGMGNAGTPVGEEGRETRKRRSVGVCGEGEQVMFMGQQIEINDKDIDIDTATVTARGRDSRMEIRIVERWRLESTKRCIDGASHLISWG
jgi:hypothetical protein